MSLVLKYRKVELRTILLCHLSLQVNYSASKLLGFLCYLMIAHWYHCIFFLSSCLFGCDAEMSLCLFCCNDEMSPGGQSFVDFGRYAYQILLEVKKIFSSLPSLVDVTIKEVSSKMQFECCCYRCSCNRFRLLTWSEETPLPHLPK